MRITVDKTSMPLPPTPCGRIRSVDWRGFAYLLKPRFWSEFWTTINEDHVWGMSAELSYSFLLAFFPFLIFLASIIGLTSIDPRILALILDDFRHFMPNQTNQEIQELLAQLKIWQGGQMALLWILLALWIASLGLNGLAAVLNRAYGVREKRSFWWVRGLALVVTVAMSFFIVLAGALLFFGDEFNRVVAGLAPGDSALAAGLLQFLYTLIRWSLIFCLLNLGLQMIYYALPATRLPWRFFSPGSILTTTGWLLGSLVLAIYIYRFADYQRLYGSLASLVILLIWFYYASLLLLLGGEIDSEIHRLRAAGDSG